MNMTAKRFEAEAGDWAFETRGEDGPVIRLSHFAVAKNEYGRRFIHAQQFSSREDAEKLVERVNAHIERHPEWQPSPQHWREGQPCYGSDCYAEENGESELARVDVEAEFGPGTYRPGTPGFIG
jgi:hypothetical protein